MGSVEQISSAFVLLLVFQLFHSLEELATGFHKKWYLFSMPFFVFLAFETVFLSFWIFVWMMPSLPHRESLMSFFNLLMFANGIQHLVWAAIVKKYVPGLVTAPLFVIAFLWVYFV